MSHLYEPEQKGHINLLTYVGGCIWIDSGSFIERQTTNRMYGNLKPGRILKQAVSEGFREPSNNQEMNRGRFWTDLDQFYHQCLSLLVARLLVQERIQEWFKGSRDVRICSGACYDWTVSVDHCK